MAAFPYKSSSLVVCFGLGAFIWSGCEKSVAYLAKEGEAPIVLEKTMLDLGEISDGETRIGHIKITNRSTNPVKIDHVGATCGCTSASVTVETIPPVGTSVLNVELAPQGRRGPFGSAVTVEWTEKEKTGNRQGKVEAVVQASGVFLVDAKPGNIDFGDVSVELSSLEKSIVLTRGTQKLSFADIKISSDSDAVKARIEKRDMNSWIVSATLEPGRLASGPKRATLEAAFYDTNNVEVARRQIAVRADVAGPVSAKPKSLFFGVMPSGETREGVIKLEFARGNKVPIKRVRTEPGSSCLVFEVGEDPAESPTSATLRYFVDTAGRKGDQSGRLFVEFQDESIGDVSVPFILHVK